VITADRKMNRLIGFVGGAAVEQFEDSGVIINHVN
jgi:hypothetical protein